MLKLETFNQINRVNETCWQIGISPDEKFLALSFYSQPEIVQLCNLKGQVFKMLEGYRRSVHSIASAIDIH